MRYIYLLVLFCLACSSTVTAGGTDAVAGAAGTETAAAGSAAAATGGAGGTASTGSGSAPASGGASGSVNVGGAGGEVSCTAALPTNFAWTVDDANGYIAACYYCVDSPCWTAELSWDESTLHFDEYASTITVTVNIHSSGSIRINRSGTSCSGSGICSLSIPPDLSLVSTLKVARVSNGYQVIETDKYTQWDAVQEGSCTNIDLVYIELSVNKAWHDALYGIILPCVR